MSEPPSPLWAPWRMEYLLAPKGRRCDGGCIFCTHPAAPEEELRGLLVLVANEHYSVILNRYPFTAGHLMVIPRRHVGKLMDLTDAENAALFTGVREVGARLRAAVKPHGVNYGINEGEAAGAGIAEHLHVHLVPRWAGDTNFMPVIGNMRVMAEYLDETWQRLRPALEGLPGAVPVR